jgi:hypothetical protein
MRIQANFLLKNASPGCCVTENEIAGRQLAVAIPSIAAAKTSAPSGTPKDCEANYRDNAHGFNCWKSRKSFPPMHQQQAARGEVKGGRVPSGHSIAGREFAAPAHGWGALGQAVTIGLSVNDWLTIIGELVIATSDHLWPAFAGSFLEGDRWLKAHNILSGLSAIPKASSDLRQIQ